MTEDALQTERVNHELDAEKQEAVDLDRTRRMAHAAIGDLASGEDGCE